MAIEKEKNIYVNITIPYYYNLQTNTTTIIFSKLGWITC